MQFHIKVFLIVICLANFKEATGLYIEHNNDKNVKQLAVPRIVNGHNAILGQFPYQVLLRSKKGLVCGGSIISRNFILTAAHCVDSGASPSSYYVCAGTVNFSSCSAGTPVAQLILHPDYQPNEFTGDIALLKLGKPLTFSKTIKSIPLQTEEIKAGELLVTSGWGSLYTHGPVAKMLQYTKMRVLSSDKCSEDILCLDHIAGNGICGGDSGGPAVYKGKLAGVASFGDYYCGRGIPDGFTKVSAYLDFIRKNSDVK